MTTQRLRPIGAALTIALAALGCDTETLEGLPDASTADSGAQVRDAGLAPTDSGAEIPDAGEVTADAGEVMADAGQAPSDGGEVAPDAGEVMPDAGQVELPLFSFFVTSIEAMRALSGSEDGFGGDLRFGQSTGLEGADAICTAIAEGEMPGASAKIWRAFLSASTDGQGGGPVNAIDRIGSGPWYDRNGRLVAQNVQGLLGDRPSGDAVIAADLPNERGESQLNQPGPGSTGTADNHDVLTGSNAQGRYQGGGMNNTCNDWTSTTVTGRPNCGHSWPARSGRSWAQAHRVAGCAAVVNLLQNGAGSRDCEGVGCAGGYGAIYCFALEP